MVISGLIACVIVAASPSDWWADQPVVKHELPVVEDDAWCRNGIDHFILARLETKGLSPSSDTDRRTLIRRATYDLTGLPPSPEAVEAFVEDDRPDAYERVIEELLASPQYGVKWGRHWLDRVRWAETDGYERDRLKPGAWRYRDWVVQAFNEDMPYDRFITLQLAGDEVPDRDFSTMVATGFLHLGIRDDEPTDPETAIYDDLDGMLDTTCRATLAISMGCARCHDHKKDPIPQADYYQMLSFFRGLKPYRLGYGNAVIPAHYVRNLPLNFGNEDSLEIESWLARQESLRNEVTAMTLEALESQGGAGSIPDIDTALGLPAAGMLKHVDFEGDPEICEAGISGHALLVNAVENSFTIPRPVQNDFTISFSFRPDADGAGSGEPRWFLGSGLVDGEISGIVNDFGISWFKGGRVTAGVGNPETFLASPTGLELGKWHHAALTRNRESGKVQLWVDGELVDEKIGGKQSLDAPQDLAVGRMYPGGNPFPGAIDEIRIYDRVLTSRELLSIQDSKSYGEDARRLVEQRLNPEQADRFNQIYEERLSLKRPWNETREILAAIEVGTKAPPTHRLPRGNPHNPAEEVDLAVPVIFGGEVLQVAPSTHGDSSGRRLALAEWITDPENPRTSRVLVNRMWQHHFGRGIARTPDDFGKLGFLPTHPELLDWLASQAIEYQWGMKDMHRLMMTSSTYRMGSSPSEEAMDKDPMNDLFSRFEMRRLTAEEIRDSLLSVNGKLNTGIGGESVYPPLPEEVLATASRPDQAWKPSPENLASRRSLYVHVKRSLKMPLLETFDMADTDSACPVRFNTTVPTQALTMLNSDELNRQADRLLKRLLAETNGSPEAVIRRGLALVTQEPPHVEDVSSCLALMSGLESEGLSRKEALHYTCLGMLNLTAFMYID